MSNIKKELIDFETHCFETGQLQVGELMSTAIMHIAELEKERDKYKAHYDLSVEKDYPKKKFPRQHKAAQQAKALKVQE